MSLLQEPALAEDLIQAVRDVRDYGDWQDRTGYARLDAKARYDSAIRRLGSLVSWAGGAVPADPSCLVPGFDGALFSPAWRDALWARFFLEAPRRQRRSVERYNIVKRA